MANTNSEFNGTPKFSIDDYVKTIFPEDSRHFSEGRIVEIREETIYEQIEVCNSKGDTYFENDFCNEVGFHFIYVLDNGRSFDESIIMR